MSDAIFLLGLLAGLVWPVCWLVVMVHRSNDQRLIETNEDVQITRRLEMMAKHDLDTRLLLEAHDG